MNQIQAAKEDSKIVAVRVPLTLYRQVEVLAMREHNSDSAVLRRLISRGLEREHGIEDRLDGIAQALSVIGEGVDEVLKEVVCVPVPGESVES